MQLGTKIRTEPTLIWKFYISDAIKEFVKNAIKHPNSRTSSYRDWDSRSHRARYDSRKTKEVLGWQPAGDKQAMIQRGIIDAVRAFMA